jgi:hypothetical protein
MDKTFPPEFSALMAQYRDTAAGLGENHPTARRLWLLVETTAPEWFRAEMNAVAKEMGLLPATYGYDDDGQRMYSLDDIAANLGITPDEARQAVEKMKADREALGLPTDGIISDGRTIHRVQ